MHPRGDGPFQVLERINDNAYKIDLPSHYGNVSATFNVSDLSLYDAGDSRTNLFKEGGNDGDQLASRIQEPKSNDPLQGIGGPMTRARAKRVSETLQGLVMELQERELSFTKGESTFIHIIQASKVVDEGMEYTGKQVTLKNDALESQGGRLA